MVPKALLLLILCLACHVACEPNIIFKLRKMNCLISPGYSANPLCVIKAVNWNKAVAQMDVDILKPIRNLTVRFRLFKRDYNNQFHPFLVDVTLNMCDVMSKKSYQAYGTITRKITQKFSNFNHSCPFVGHLMARNLTIDENLFPVFPLGIYEISLNLVEHHGTSEEYVGGIDIFFDAMEPVALKKKKKV